MNHHSAPQAGEQKQDQAANQERIPGEIGKLRPNGNPLVAHKFGADPYALVFNNRVYLYMTSDKLEYDKDGLPQKNSYSSINRITVISSDDLINWTDHGEIRVAGPQGAATWASQSWAPAAAHRNVDGKDCFFLYFANNASGIGVLSAPTPVGPWIDPIGKALITRETPGVEEVTWLFDPAVIVDDDHQAYIYFGGGIPQGKAERPDTARVMRLGEDMISVVGKAKVIQAPYMFEDSGIHKYNNSYYFTYCSNFVEGDRPEGSPPPGEIAYMTSVQPMGPWTYQGTLLQNPGHFFDVGGNNHHAIFQLADQWYIAYHAQTLSQAMNIPDGYRSTHLNRVEHNEATGKIQKVHADYQGVDQIKCFNPYERVSGSTIGWSSRVTTEQYLDSAEISASDSNIMFAKLQNDSWIAVSKVDFESEGPTTCTATIGNQGTEGTLELRLDRADGPLIGEIIVSPATESLQWTELTTNVTGAKGVQDLYIKFKSSTDSSTIFLREWKFNRQNEV
ncbi:glycoside hydrolase family 43 protein [Paenibacillus sp. FSL R5-0766]|uniref:glycoside hydrolase family 43 protein n=1 Tax=unclassified Paenibacillus TaxID=185978 RepID=UPI00096C01A9|nr:glycoside hydrolase family 43 protein [Paenibacillus sp. FSL R5-0765]OMF64363.1 arabinoxylan arabinofuranohydrolase [Paenibacillus sp. FSL R5-0765]